MRGLNAAGPTLVRDLSPPSPLGPRDFGAGIASGVALDVRQVDLYAGRHVPGSLAIPFRSSFAVWLGWLVPPDSRLYLLGDGVPVAEVLTEARLVGYDLIEGVLDGGIEAWVGAGLPTTSTPLRSIWAADAALRGGAVLIDVREPDEVADGAVPDALAIPLGSLRDAVDGVPKNSPVIVTCGVGERAISAASILEREGFTSVASLDGGMDAWRDAGLRVVSGAGPSGVQ
jgi:rhodanese-related sulfurtransferase